MGPARRVVLRMCFPDPYQKLVTHEPRIRRPMLVSYARYRWDRLRQEHQLVYPEGILILNETGAAILQLCDGRLIDELVAALHEKYSQGNPAADVDEFLQRLTNKGLLHDAQDA